MKTTVTILTFFILTNFTNSLFACDCKELKTVKEEVKYSDAVFVGTIITKKLVILGDTSMNYTTVARYDLLVQNIYKGETIKDTLTIYTGLGVSDCGIRFDVGLKYVVYGKNETYILGDFKYPKSKNTFWTNNCFRTMVYNQDEINEIKKYVKNK